MKDVPYPAPHGESWLGNLLDKAFWDRRWERPQNLEIVWRALRMERQAEVTYAKLFLDD